MLQAPFPQRHPYLAAALLFLATLAAFLTSGTLVTVFEWPVMSLYVLALGTVGLLCAALLAQTGWWRAIGFRGPYAGRQLWLFWVAFVPVVGNLVDGVTVTEPQAVAGFMGLALLSGLVEETVFRGLILRALLPVGRWRAVTLSALLFGGMHILNALSISSPAYAVLQVAYAAAIGFGYAALVVHTGTLWPLVAAHTLTNFAGFIAAGGAGSAGAVATRDMLFAAVYVVLFSLYGLFVLRLPTTPLTAQRQE